MIKSETKKYATLHIEEPVAYMFRKVFANERDKTMTDFLVELLELYRLNNK